MNMKFTGICLITDNVPALIKFYTKVLGVEAVGNDIHAELKTEGANISIFSTEGMEGLVPHSMQGTGHGNFTIGFEVRDIKAEYEKLKALDIKFLKYPTAHPWGCTSLWFRDPDGNIVDFYATQSK
jgi:catechol 2,3-dioxygenase-like lactoylglutathione lyase family enzyme